MKDILLKVLLYPRPLRILFLTKFMALFAFGEYETRLLYDGLERPWYGYCVWNAANLARSLGLNSVSVIEFGVAGARGLLNLEGHAKEIEKCTGVSISVYGFDRGTGLPNPANYRDMPYRFKAESYKMDRAKLEARLERAQLVIGEVTETISSFANTFNPPPIGAVMFDLDYYSSTAEALRLFNENNQAMFLPRVYCYFDDVTDDGIGAYNDSTGALGAIRDFNAAWEDCKIAKVNALWEARRIPSGWNEKIYVAHFFKHLLYNVYVSSKPDQLPI